MVSAVVLAYNRCAEVLKTVSELKKFSTTLPFPLEIIVVDNESVDDTSTQIKQLHPDINLVRIDKNKGIAGWNAGFAVAKYKYMLVLDDDSHPESGIAEAVNYMEQHPDTGILALNVTSGPYLTDTWLWQNGQPWQHEQEILGFFGCGALIKKEVYEKIGGFNEWMIVYGHEWEYGIRCIEAGYKVKYFKHSSINHRASSINRSQRRARTFGTRNDMGIVYKYFSNQRWKYIFTMLFNNIKRAKSGDFVSAYYDILGFIEFMKFRHTLSYTPVSKQTQKFFTDNYMNTHPVLGFITKPFKKR
ncbi:glycosyltransferase family 2 protein [Mucilaginibacter koreensis]